MTNDIVERARATDSGGLINELADEIERLQTDLTGRNRDLGEMYAENEKLRALVEAAKLARKIGPEGLFFGPGINPEPKTADDVLREALAALDSNDGSIAARIAQGQRERKPR